MSSEISYIQIICENDLLAAEKPEFTPISLEDTNVVEAGDTDVLDINIATKDTCEEFKCTKDDTNSERLNAEWNKEETKYLLKKYNKYIVLTGPRKKFRTKRELWQRISQDMKEELRINRTAAQCENRYKNELRRWRRRHAPNEVQQKDSSSISNTVSSSSQVQNHINANQENKEEKKICEVLLEIFQKKEESRERRHKEKMELIKKLLNC